MAVTAHSTSGKTTTPVPKKLRVSELEYAPEKNDTLAISNSSTNSKKVSTITYLHCRCRRMVGR